MATESSRRRLNSGRSGGASEEDEEKIIDILDGTDVFFANDTDIYYSILGVHILKLVRVGQDLEDRIL